LRYLDRMQPLGLVVVRLTLGVILIGHGSHKMYGHLHEYAGYIGSLGLPAWLGYVSACTEFFGGILLIMGLFTRIAACAVLVNMSVAIAKVHWKHGLLGAGGYEFPLSLWVMAFALIFFGAGAISIDAIRGGVGGWGKSK
jgi:putative oxidoreductase